MNGTNRNPLGRRCASCVLALTCSLAWPSPAAARQRDDPRHTRASDAAPAGLGADLSLLGGALLHAATAPARWDGDAWLALPALGAGVMGLSALDADVRDLMHGNRSGVADDITAVVEPFGADYSFAVMAGLYVTGLAGDDSKARAVAVEALASSLVAGGLVTPTLQYLTGRYRPWKGEDPHTWVPFSRNISFPSGHTTQAFAVASVIAARYDSPWVKVTAYSLAAAVGASRMYHNAHYLSDVAAAAVIGTVVGTAVARFGRARRLSLGPSADGAGIAFSVRF